MGEASGDSYLKLAALDPNDPHGIAEFMTAYGELGVRGQYDWGERPAWSAFWFPPDEIIASLEDALDHAVSLRGEAATHADTFLEAQMAILLMRDMVAAWRALQGAFDPMTHHWESPMWEYRSEYPADSPPWCPEGPGPFLAGCLDDGLGPFTPRLLLHRPDDKGTSAPVQLGDGTAWSACCADLFNHIVEGATYKTCCNETCRRLFVRQEGRSAHGQHRTTGVKYCSAACARAQAQRVYRRRKSAD